MPDGKIEYELDYPKHFSIETSSPGTQFQVEYATIHWWILDYLEEENIGIDVDDYGYGIINFDNTTQIADFEEFVRVTEVTRRLQKNR